MEDAPEIGERRALRDGRRRSSGSYKESRRDSPRRSRRRSRDSSSSSDSDGYDSDGYDRRDDLEDGERLLHDGETISPQCFPTCWDKATRTYYVITNKRITRYTHTCVCCCVHVENVYMSAITDIEFDQGCLECLGCTGTITVHSSDKTSPTLEISGLPGARRLWDALEKEVRRNLEVTQRQVD